MMLRRSLTNISVGRDKMPAEITITFAGNKKQSVKLANWSSKKDGALRKGMDKAGLWMVGALKTNLRLSNKGLIGASPYSELRSRDGILRASIQRKMHSKGMTVGTDKKYGAVNEFGGKIRITENMRKHSLFQIAPGEFRRFAASTSEITIPPRPWFWPTIQKHYNNFIMIIKKELFKPLG